MCRYLGREARLILTGVAELGKLGVRVKSMTEEFDTSSATGRLMLTMLSGFAAHVREDGLRNEEEREILIPRFSPGVTGVRTSRQLPESYHAGRRSERRGGPSGAYPCISRWQAPRLVRSRWRQYNSGVRRALWSEYRYYCHGLSRGLPE